MEMDTSLPEEPIPEGLLELSVPAVNIPVMDQFTADDDDDVTELSKNQNIEQELTKELLSGSITAPSLSSETTKHPSSSLDTTQSLVHLFQNAIRAGHENVTSAGRTPEVPNRNHVTSVTNHDDQIN
ncbi:7195_t:CDS:2, partial [Funneliformis geosporum]